ncbi:MAG: flagellar basal body-associated FliL family protein [Leptospiraceae bacterium]|nr:flagellar basal body-associated FliL family protein [Leptospiraceae bacterium]MDW8307607.1 flagellar basal body-associated FliL family protein [Leptospiraceae bacterium]
MAEEELLEEEEEQEKTQVPAGRSKIVTILLIAAGVLTFILLTVLISYYVAKSVRTASYEMQQNIVIAPAPPPLTIYRFPKEFRVNTADTEEGGSFIQVQINLGYVGENKQLEAELANRSAQLMHIINILLSGKRKEELMGQMQKQNLAEEIKSQINMLLREGKIEEVYFESIVIS